MFLNGVQAMPMRGANPHWWFCMSESLTPGVAPVLLLPAINRPEFVMTSVPASHVCVPGSPGCPLTAHGVYLYFFGSNDVRRPYFSESGPSKSQRTPPVMVRSLMNL